MKWVVEFRVEAQKDILEAIAWYEKNREGLGGKNGQIDHPIAN